MYSTLLSETPGIGFSYAKKLAFLGLLTVEDLINHYPFRYDDFSEVSTALEAQIGQKITLQGEIWSIANIYTRSRKIITKAVFNDGTTPVELTWFNSPWLTKQISSGDQLQISGKISKYKNKFTMIAPVWEKLTQAKASEVRGVADLHSFSPPQADVFEDQDDRTSEPTIHTGRLVPIYPETYGVSSKWLRSKINQILPALTIEDPLPEVIKNNLIDLPEALQKVHFPNDWADVEKARARLEFDELFYIQLATQKVRQDWRNKPNIGQFQVDQKKVDSFLKKLPFQLTKAQLRVIEEILADLQTGRPMNRLVQGEVGSGKTIVAAVIAYLTFLNGYRSFYMAPTEILAFQHFDTLSNLLEPLGIKVGIYTGSRKFTQKHNVKTTPDIIIGTHALLSAKLDIPDVGLIIIDEQQRFGVEQRSVLRSKAKVPHFLTMTATPIPRTVALTLYGDLDLSIIDELPKGRLPVRTHVVPSKKRLDAYTFIEKKVREGDQVYIITPLIDESETLQSVKAATVEFEKLQREVFPDLKLGLLHGRLKSKDKEAVLNAFKNRQIAILVSTSVVEVGVDVTNATIMVIEGAERFGLAQLHQLRGRVGRGSKESFCFLFTGVEDSQNTSRLKNLEKIHDGLKLSELDLKIRGSGEIFGKKQSGRFELKIASLTNLTLIEKTKTAAEKLLKDNPTLDKYPLLQAQLQELASNVMPD